MSAKDPSERLPMQATSLDGVVRYFVDRARQGLHEGWTWDGDIEPLAHYGELWGARTSSQTPDGDRFQSIYVMDQHTGKGHFSRALRADPTPIVTAGSCEIEAFLTAKGIPYRVAGRFEETVEYRAITAHSRGRCAERSGVHYMNHIDEGLGVLGRIGASDAAMRAFSLHPLLQADTELAANASRVAEVSSSHHITLLVMEYRKTANAHLSYREDEPGAHVIELSPLAEVNDMLRADKIQNYKDFLAYHDGTHPRSESLHRYFERWLDALEIPRAEFDEQRTWLDVGARVNVLQSRDL